MEKPVDYTKLPPELVDKLQKIEARKPENMQIKRLEEIQSILEMLFTAMRDDKGKEERSAQTFEKIAREIRDYVKRIEAKEAPETPDTAKPVVESVKALEKALTASIKGIQVKPEVNVAAPNVKVDAPSVDMRGVEKAVKEVGKAFDTAIAKMPKVEIPEDKDYTSFYEQMLEQLQSIDTASRMKPMFPVSQLNTLAATDFATSTKQDDIITAVEAVETAVSGIGSATPTVSKIDDTTTANVIYIGKAELTGAAISTASAVWQIKKLDTSSLALDKKWADGDANYNNVWDDRASLTYY